MIYLKLEKEPENINEILTELYSLQAGDYGRKSVETYYNSDCTELECNAGCYRSIDDIIEIVQTYLPKASIKDIVEAIVDCRIETSYGTQYPIFWHCSDIGAPTLSFRIKEHVNLDFYSNFYSDDDMYQSQFESWEEVFSIIGIFTEYDAQERAGHDDS